MSTQAALPLFASSLPHSKTVAEPTLDPPPPPTAYAALSLSGLLPTALLNPSGDPVPGGFHSLETPYVAFYFSSKDDGFCPRLLENLVRHHPVFQTLVTVIHIPLDGADRVAGLHGLALKESVDPRRGLADLGLSDVTNAAVVVVERESGKVVRSWDDVETNPDGRLACLERFVEGDGNDLP